ncbi:hypothetical protein BN1723_020954, partial [Verticillium longisporum]
SGRITRDGSVPGSDPASFSNRDPNTSEANRLGGANEALVWGTNISVDDSFTAFKDFLRHFTKKYRMYKDGASEAE